MNKSDLILDCLKEIPVLEMSILPTPLHRLNNMSARLSIDLYCKRDDLTAFAFGGNKTRKLDYLVMDAISTGYDSLISFGAVQSNWCRMTATAGSVNGLDVFLVLSGEKPGKETSNLLLDRLAGANITFIESTERDDIIKEVNKKILELKNKGRKPYYMPVGGSVARGSLGYIRAMAEIMEYSETSGVDFREIILASGSAGTQAGLLAGQVICGWQGHIRGMAVSRPRDEQEQIVLEIARDSLDFIGYEYEEQSLTSGIHVDDSYLGDGYRLITPGCRQAIQDFVRYEGIFLDEVYTGKAAAGLIDYAKKGKFSSQEPVLFIHTGGSVQLFE
ncbi:MAG TPA: D-cysteine desulfhydrase family protein [Bacteroidetes bacterium]|nr:D-cysteine desulfhydrase family protein [Bacteroidota bacterium]